MPKYSFPQPCFVDRLIFLTLYCPWVPDVMDSQKFYGNILVKDVLDADMFLNRIHK